MKYQSTKIFELLETKILVILLWLGLKCSRKKQQRKTANKVLLMFFDGSTKLIAGPSSGRQHIKQPTTTSLFLKHPKAAQVTTEHTSSHFFFLYIMSVSHSSFHVCLQNPKFNGKPNQRDKKEWEREFKKAFIGEEK